MILSQNHPLKEILEHGIKNHVIQTGKGYLLPGAVTVEIQRETYHHKEPKTILDASGGCIQTMEPSQLVFDVRVTVNLTEEDDG